MKNKVIFLKCVVGGSFFSLQLKSNGIISGMRCSKKVTLSDTSVPVKSG